MLRYARCARQRNCAGAGSAMLSVVQLLDQARAETGLDDFGDDDFRAGLEKLVECTSRMRLSAMGQAATHAEIQRWLINRLRFADDLKRHPEILDEEIDNPIVILGLPRTGTTKLQRLIAADPGIVSLKFWQAAMPARMPDAVPGQEDPRIGVARQMIAMLAQVSPGLLQSHPLQAEFPEEEFFLQMQTFRTPAIYLNHPASGYAEWVATQSLKPTYRYMKQLLQYLQWQDRAGKSDVGERRWLLKTPLHLGNLDLLVDLFPRATYLCTHRELREVLPSFCRLMEMFWRIKLDEVDMHEIGDHMLSFWSGEMRRHLEQRDALADRLDIVDIRYEEVCDGPFDVVRRIYRHIGRELTPQCEQAMRDWDARDLHGSFGGYRYTLEQYGLDATAIDNAFAEYRRRFLS